MENSVQYFSVMTNTLKYVGLNLIDENLNKQQKIRSVFMYGLSCSLTLAAVWSTFYYPLYSNLWIDSALFVPLLVFGVMRSMVLLYNRKNICDLLYQLQSMCFMPDIIKANPKGKEEVDKLKRVVYWMGIFSVVNVFVNMLGETLLFLWKRLFLDTDEWIIALGFPVGGFDTSHSPNFEILFSYEFASFFVSGFLIIVGDMLIASLLISASAHLKIVQHCLRHPNMEDVSPELEESTYVYIKEVIKYHAGVIDIVETIEKILHVPMWFAIIGDVCTLCFSLCIISAENFSLDESFTAIIGGVFVVCRVCFYCYWGTQIRDQSMEIANAAADFDWLDKNRDVKRAIIIIMARAQKPLCVTAGKISILSLELFVNIMKATYSYLTILKNVRK